MNVSSQFDPYHRWLGIPPEEQPAHHYRMLGLELYEADPEVIQEACDKQMTHVQTHKTGPYSHESQEMLNELARVKITLMNEERRVGVVGGGLGGLAAA